jgi:hypothetical protein
MGGVAASCKRGELGQAGEEARLRTIEALRRKHVERVDWSKQVVRAAA